MFWSSKIVRVLSSVIALSMSAGCAEQMSSQPQAQAAADVELAGAWYEVYFDTNSYDLNGRAQTIVAKVANVVENAGPTRVTVIGKTDRVGAPPANMALARERAEAVRDALVVAGVPAGIITTTWAGEGKQAVETLDDAAEPLNRVVDIKVVKVTP